MIDMYAPQPIDTTKIQISNEIKEIAETLARNVHENWASDRIKQGWKYGPKRNDDKKEHPCLIPYEDLPEEEKEYDRRTAMETIKVILGLGWRIEKK